MRVQVISQHGLVALILDQQVVLRSLPAGHNIYWPLTYFPEGDCCNVDCVANNWHDAFVPSAILSVAMETTKVIPGSAVLGQLRLSDIDPALQR